MVSCQKGPTRHAYAWQIGPFLMDTLEFKHNITMVFAWWLCTNKRNYSICFLEREMNYRIGIGQIWKGRDFIMV